MEDILKAPPGCLLFVTSYEAKLIDRLRRISGVKLNCLDQLKMQSIKKDCVSKGAGSTKKRVHPNVTQQYTPGDDSRYTVNDGEVSLSKTVDNKSIQKD